jgi:hypothetical protein
MRNAAVVLSLAFASSALAGGGPRFTTAYGQTYAEVGDPGNADYTYEVFPGGPTRSVGGVNYRYRIAVTEVTNAQWAEFANAIAPHLDSIGGWGSDFAPTLSYDGFNPQGDPVFGVVAGAEHNPARMGWRWAARYTNWLHNDKATTLDAFQSGAYDASTFGREVGEFGFQEYTDQSTRSDGARFWIPSEDEWVKAAYYDPNRFGERQGGYWQFPGMSDDPLVTAPPDQGGETNAGGYWYGGEGSGLVPFDVGSYPDAASYYGVLDASGGQWEWTETWTSDLFERARYVIGTTYFLDPNDIGPTDLLGIDLLQSGLPDGELSGLRLAMTVPAPGAASTGVVLMVLCTAFGRRRSND